MAGDHVEQQLGVLVRSNAASEYRDALAAGLR
jgi:hypothetical protein